jgi:hypothetical protein
VSSCGGLPGKGPVGLRHDVVPVWRALRDLICRPRALREKVRDDFRKFGEAIGKGDNSSGNQGQIVLSSSRKSVFRRRLQKLFKSWSDVQTVTGIALLFAAILLGNDVSLYHTSIVLDLRAIAADGQAIMLFYAF